MFSAVRAAALMLLSFQAAVLHAEETKGPVVVELYTSQGCSSCPPADALLHELAKREDVIALALHVDYWDYIGWKDAFASPKHGDRQRHYARRSGNRMIYTPQMIVGGRDHVVGNKPMKVSDTISAHANLGDPVSVTLDRNGSTLNIAAKGAFSGTADVHLVRFSPSETVRITRGENRGRTLEYANIVRSWETIEQWDGVDALELTEEIAGPAPVVVIVQAEDYGVVLGAAALR